MSSNFSTDTNNIQTLTTTPIGDAGQVFNHNFQTISAAITSQIAATALKANKASPAVAGNVANLNSSGNIVDSGVTLASKANKASPAVAGNVANLDTNGNPVDSGVALASKANASTVTTLASTVTTLATTVTTLTTTVGTKADKVAGAVDGNIPILTTAGDIVDSGSNFAALEPAGTAATAVSMLSLGTLLTQGNDAAGGDITGLSNLAVKSIDIQSDSGSHLHMNGITLALADGAGSGGGAFQLDGGTIVDNGVTVYSSGAWQGSIPESQVTNLTTDLSTKLDKSGGTLTGRLILGINDSNAGNPSISVTNSNSAGKSQIYVQNDVGANGGLGVFGSTFAVASLIGNVFAFASNDIIFCASGNSSAGGSQAIRFRPDGYLPSSDHLILQNGTATFNCAVNMAGRVIRGYTTTYASNAAAISAGLSAGTIYADSSGNLKVVI